MITIISSTSNLSKLGSFTVSDTIFDPTFCDPLKTIIGPLFESPRITFGGLLEESNYGPAIVVFWVYEGEGVGSLGTVAGFVEAILTVGTDVGSGTTLSVYVWLVEGGGVAMALALIDFFGVVLLVLGADSGA